MRPSGRSPARPRILLTSFLLFAAALLASVPDRVPVLRWPGAMASSQAPAPEPASAPDSTADDQRGDQLRREICTRCHVLPPPDVLPRDRWRDAIARMYLRRENQPEPPTPGQAGMLSLPEDFTTIAGYYRRHAPEALPEPEPWPSHSVEVWENLRIQKPKTAPTVSAPLEHRE
jgi:hypothetical protein